MRKIKVENWTAKGLEGEDIKENTMSALNVLISNKKPEDMPRGLDNFRLFSRLSKSFETAEKTGNIELEESDYAFLKKTIENDIPSVWGMNPDITKAMENFMSEKQG